MASSGWKAIKWLNNSTENMFTQYVPRHRRVFHVNGVSLSASRRRSVSRDRRYVFV